MLLLKPLKESPASTRSFLSARGMEFYSRLAHATELLFGSSSQTQVEALARELGPYALSDKLVARLARRGIKLRDGIVPFASAEDYLQPLWLSRAHEKSFTVWEICELADRELWRPEVIYLHPESIPVAESFIRVIGRNVSVWEQIEIIDALECHHNPELRFSVGRIP